MIAVLKWKVSLKDIYILQICNLEDVLSRWILFFQVKTKRYWPASSTVLLKNALYKSVTVKKVLLVGMDVSDVWRAEWDRKETEAQPLKEWYSPWGHDIYWLEPARMNWFPLDLEPRYAFIVVYQHAKLHTRRSYDHSEANCKRSKSGQWSNSWKSWAFPQNSWNNHPTH